MQLLDLHTVENKKREDIGKRISLVEKIQTEENKARERLNKILDEERKEKKRILDESEKGLPEIETKKNILLGVVKNLEERKKQALIPVFEIKKEAEKILAENISHGEELSRRKKELAGKEETVVKTIEDLLDEKASAEEKKQELNKREEAVVESEKELKKSTESLSSKWIEFYDKVAKTNEDIERREKEIEDGRKANAEIRLHNEEVAEKIKEEDRAIKDKYVALEQATKHLKS